MDRHYEMIFLPQIPLSICTFLLIFPTLFRWLSFGNKYHHACILFTMLVRYASIKKKHEICITVLTSISVWQSVHLRPFIHSCISLKAPLYGDRHRKKTKEEIIKHHPEFLIFVNGFDEIYSERTRARKSYVVDDFHFQPFSFAVCRAWCLSALNG